MTEWKIKSYPSDNVVKIVGVIRREMCIGLEWAYKTVKQGIPIRVCDEVILYLMELGCEIEAI